MSEANESSQPISATPKKPLISLPFILVVSVLAVGGYFAGPWVMTMVMYQQEKAKNSRVGDLSEVAGAVSADDGEDAGGRGGRRGGGGFDPEAFFAERDADSNGKIEGDEISERMQQRVESIDTDGDGAITKEEFLAGMQNRGGRGGGRGGAGGGRPGGGRPGGGRPGSGRPASESDDASPSETAEDAAAEQAESDATEQAASGEATADEDSTDQDSADEAATASDDNTDRESN